jgi:D-alanyl-lipoteichoic acid acyltransferase DltB (MBOAT superfamily)
VVVVHYVAGLYVGRHRDSARRKCLLAVACAIAVNVAVLTVFKYKNLLLEATVFTMGLFGNESWVPKFTEITLPVAISFFTFQSIAYTVDVYRGEITAEKRFDRFFLFIIFFPQLIAGPIVRAGQFFYQIARKRPARLSVFLAGSYLIIRGVFLKMVVADNLGIVVDAYWDDIGGPGVPSDIAFTVALFFSFQLFCDFMAYTDIARGIAYQLGVRLPENFNAPFLASSFSGFWRRWHITLSQWVRDYIYIPLGGRSGGVARNLAVLFASLLLSGLWHGANLTFLVWGGLHGIFLAAERGWRTFRDRRASPEVAAEDHRRHPVITGVIGFMVVQLAWVFSLIFFRSRDFGHAIAIIDNILGLGTTGTADSAHYALIPNGWLFCLPVVLIHLRALLTERFAMFAPRNYERPIVGGIMLAMTLMLYTRPDRFIYFQF